MIHLTLVRIYEGRGATWGEIQTDGLHLYSMERTWQDNKPNVSCIPTGKYICQRDLTGKHKYYRVCDVPGRSDIEIHPANYPAQLQGCIALGMEINTVGLGSPLLESRKAMDMLLEYTKGQDFILTIKNINEVTYV